MNIRFDRNTLLGEGAFGSVFLGEFEGRRVAVKRIELHLCMESTEEEVLRQLDHPNIVKLFHGESDGYFRYIALELCDASLDKLFLKSDHPEKYHGPIPRLIEIFLQLASALEHIHSKGFVHLDIKPYNILIAMRRAKQHAEVTIKLAGFCQSKRVNESGLFEFESGIRRTTSWLAPELLMSYENNRDCVFSVKIDVFALALVFGYLLLGGEHLYGFRPYEHHGQNITERNIMERIIMEMDIIEMKIMERIKMEKINMEKIDKELRDLYEEKLLLKMLEYEPKNRMTSSQVVEELTAIKNKLAAKEKKLRQLCANDFQKDLTTKIKKIFHREMDINAKDETGRNALHYLCEKNSSTDLIDAIKLLIDFGIDVKAKSANGSNALHYLVRYNSSPYSYDANKILTDSGVDNNEKDNDGKSAYDYSLVKTMTQMKIWINQGAQLGQGGYAVVFKGKFGGKEVAVKRVLKEHVNDSEEENWNKLDHPNIVKLIHSESDDNFMYYALELCIASLDKLFLKKEDPKKYNGPMPRHIVIFHQLAAGLEHIHSKNIIHRDIKPQNILISSTPNSQYGEVTMKWADFGLSKRTSERGTFTITKNKGTPNWFAPEIVKRLKENIEWRGTVKSDVFALALVFGCLLLDGEHLYGSKVNKNIKNKTPINMERIDSNLRNLYKDDLLSQMLEDEPGKRISSTQVVNQLKTIMDKLVKKEEVLRKLCTQKSNPDLAENIKDLLNFGIDVNAKDNEEMNALHLLCRNNSNSNLISAIKILTQFKIDVNAKNNDGMNALHLLCRNNSSSDFITAIEILVKCKIDVNARDNYGSNALHYLCRNNSSQNLIEAINILSEFGVDAEAKTNDGWNALHYMCTNNYVSNLNPAIQNLIQIGINVNAKENNGRNALHILCEYNQNSKIDAIKLLMQLGINPKAKTKDGSNALHYLCSNNSKSEEIKFLIESGIDVNAKNNDEKNALHFSCKSGSNSNLIGAIETLIQCGIDASVRDKEGLNSLDYLQKVNSLKPNQDLTEAMQIIENVTNQNVHATKRRNEDPQPHGKRIKKVTNLPETTDG